MKKRFRSFIFVLLAFMAILLVMPSAFVIHVSDGSVRFEYSAFALPSPEPEPEHEHESDVYTQPAPGPTPGPLPEQTPAPEPDPAPAPEVIPGPPVLPEFKPHATENTEPDILLDSYAIMANREIVESFSFEDPIDFDFGYTYSQIEGITTFRGNNFRDSASYGYADIKNAKFGNKWSRDTASLTAPDGIVWTGHGWSGQPHIVKWPKETRAFMNMHDWAKEQDELIEVIYPAMDGYIYFSELETGKDTRNRLLIGYTFKGSGAVDPRGYPLLYVGAGYNSDKGHARIFIINLLDGSVLHTFGHGDGFALRTWYAADAAPLIDAENDRLIYASENGVLYIIDLNSNFDLTEGTMSIDPSDSVKWRYKGKRSHVNGMYWLGYEASPAILRGHAFLADNGGHLICLDLNRLEPVWVKDVLDDTNNSPVIAIEDGHPYIYISTGFQGGWRASVNATAKVPIWKIDAVNGETVWQIDYECHTVSGLSGGVQGTIAPGINQLSQLIFVSVARTPGGSNGVLAAINKLTGKMVWEFQTSRYSWSSPVCVYDKSGKGYIVYTSADANMYLLDGLTGERLDSISLGTLIESSAAVYENTIVIGTRSQKIWGIKLT